MPQYVPTGSLQAAAYDRQADAYYSAGQDAATTADNYVRTTVILASVLFLVGISTQFPVRSGRYALIGVGAALLLFAIEQILSLPGPP